MLAGSTLLFPLLLTADNAGSEFTIIQEKISGNTVGPKMVLIKQGEFIMGSPKNESGRYEDEGPQHKVTFGNPFLLAQTPTTVAQFRDFVNATNYQTDAERKKWSMWRNPSTGEWEESASMNWRHNHRGEPNGDQFPVVHVSWNDAKAYTTWLKQKTGKPYRLPSEAEMEYANRAGTTTTFWWGDEFPQTKKVANIKGEFDIPENDKSWYPTAIERQYAYAQRYTPMLFKNYGDGYWGLSPVASFQHNSFGLYDTTGNVWEWTEDCWNGSYHGAPSDGAAWTTGACNLRIVRGASYYCFPRHVRSANRWKQHDYYRGMYLGFRVARDITRDDKI
jgi:formylglycine-generating enzyme required for sulfatase activity